MLISPSLKCSKYILDHDQNAIETDEVVLINRGSVAGTLLVLFDAGSACFVWKQKIEAGSVVIHK